MARKKRKKHLKPIRSINRKIYNGLKKARAECYKVLDSIGL